MKLKKTKTNLGQISETIFWQKDVLGYEIDNLAKMKKQVLEPFHLDRMEDKKTRYIKLSYTGIKIDWFVCYLVFMHTKLSQIPITLSLIYTQTIKAIN